MPSADAATPVVAGSPVYPPQDKGGVSYVHVCAGAEASYLTRSDGAVDRIRSVMGGVTKSRLCQRLLPPEKTAYISASAGLNASYLLRDDGAVDRVKGNSEARVTDTLTPEGYPKVKYTACSNSVGPCYLLRSDGQVDMYRDGKEKAALAGAFAALSGGTEDSYHLKEDGSVDRIFAYGKVGSTYPSPAEAKYIGVATQCVMHQNQHGSGHLSAMYLVRADGRVDRVTGAAVLGQESVATMEPPAGTAYVAVSCADMASYLLRADGAVDRTTGGGTVSNTMNPPPGQTYVQVSAGQYASYFVRSDGKIDRTEGFCKVQRTIDPNEDPERAQCVLM